MDTRIKWASSLLGRTNCRSSILCAILSSGFTLPRAADFIILTFPPSIRLLPRAAYYNMLTLPDSNAWFTVDFIWHVLPESIRLLPRAAFFTLLTLPDSNGLALFDSTGLSA